MKTVKFALRDKKTGKYLTWSSESNEGADFCGPETVHIGVNAGTYVWYAETAEDAEYVRQHSTPWYNAGHETPSHSFKPSEVEVVRVEQEETVTPVDVKIPTTEEWIETKYRKTEPDHADYVLGELRKGRDMRYSIYDLREYLRGK